MESVVRKALKLSARLPPANRVGLKWNSPVRVNWAKVDEPPKTKYLFLIMKNNKIGS